MEGLGLGEIDGFAAQSPTRFVATSLNRGLCQIVMAGLGRAIHVLLAHRKTWMAGLRRPGRWAMPRFDQGGPAGMNPQ
jgi:hypothetical protein